MDPFKKRRGVEGSWGRVVRNMSFQGGGAFHTGTLLAATDVYEAEEEVIIFMDVSGVSPENLSVIANETSITVSGERKLPVTENVTRIHQLEIERGFFERTIPLPKSVDPSATSSTYKDGFLVIKMPKIKPKGKIQIKVT